MLAAAVFVALLDVAAIANAVPPCEKTVAHCYGLQLHVGVDEDGPVATPEFIASQVAVANKHFAAIDVAFQLAAVVEHSTPEVLTRRERDTVARTRKGPPVIDVFLVAKLGDIDIKDAEINGVAWKVPKKTHKVIFVSAKAWDRTLAHELGHIFGLPHSTYDISIMNKTKRDEPPLDQRTFADEELAIMRAQRKRLVRNKVIAPAKR